MLNLILNTTGDPQWDAVADLVQGESGLVTTTTITDGKTFYFANFPVYRAEFTWIPESVCTVTETPDPETP